MRYTLDPVFGMGQKPHIPQLPKHLARNVGLLFGAYYGYNAYKRGSSVNGYARLLKKMNEVPMNRRKEIRRGLIRQCATCQEFVYPEDNYCRGCGRFAIREKVS